MSLFVALGVLLVFLIGAVCLVVACLMLTVCAMGAVAGCQVGLRIITPMCRMSCFCVCALIRCGGASLAARVAWCVARLVPMGVLRSVVGLAPHQIPVIRRTVERLAVAMFGGHDVGPHLRSLVALTVSDRPMARACNELINWLIYGVQRPHRQHHDVDEYSVFEADDAGDRDAHAVAVPPVLTSEGRQLAQRFAITPAKLTAIPAKFHPALLRTLQDDGQHVCCITFDQLVTQDAHGNLQVEPNVAVLFRSSVDEGQRYTYHAFLYRCDALIEWFRGSMDGPTNPVTRERVDIATDMFRLS
jgi:hypothetical protein